MKGHLRISRNVLPWDPSLRRKSPQLPSKQNDTNQFDVIAITIINDYSWCDSNNYNSNISVNRIAQKQETQCWRDQTKNLQDHGQISGYQQTCSESSLQMICMSRSTLSFPIHRWKLITSSSLPFPNHILIYIFILPCGCCGKESNRIKYIPLEEQSQEELLFRKEVI